MRWTVVLVAGLLLVSGCLGGEGGPDPGNETGQSANTTNGDTNASNQTGNMTEPTGPTFSGYAPEGNASVAVTNESDLTFSVPPEGFVEILIEAEEWTSFNAFTYSGGSQEHEVSSSGLVLLPSDPEPGSQATSKCEEAPMLSSWISGLSGPWEMEPGIYLLMAWGNGGNFTISAAESDGEDTRIDLDPSNLSARLIDVEVETSSEGNTWTASFETTLEPADWSMLSFEVSRQASTGSYSLQSTVTTEETGECATREESGTATPVVGDTRVEATFPLHHASSSLTWSGEASFETSPSSPDPFSFNSVTAEGAQILTPSSSAASTGSY